MKIILTECQFKKMVSTVISEDYKWRDGDKGNHSVTDARFDSIPQTNDIYIKDLGYSTPEKREKWKSIGRPYTTALYSNPNFLTAHIRHLQSIFGRRISFESYDNGNMIFYILDGKKGYLTPNDPIGYDKLR